MVTKTYQAWPDNRLWSFQVTRILGLIDFGGSDFTEIHEVVQRITPNDDESWNQEWYRMGKLVESWAKEAEDKGNWLSARNGYQRACNYYRLAQFFLSGKDPRRVATLKKMHEIFEKAAKYFSNPIEKVYVDYEGHKLQGYFIPAVDKKKDKAPTMIYVNGADSLSPEVYFTAGIAMSEFGYNFLVYDAPGVGLTLYEKGLPTRYDSEKFVGAAVDYVLTRDDVDPDKIILIGESFAGYLVPRAVAYEKRIAAAAVWSPVYEFDPEAVVTTGAFKEHIKTLFGIKNEEELKKVKEKYTLKGVMEKVTCPIFLLQGAEDWLIPCCVNAALKAGNEASSKVKEVRIVERDEGLGGVAHCQKDNLHVAHHVTINWLIENGLGV